MGRSSSRKRNAPRPYLVGGIGTLLLLAGAAAQETIVDDAVGFTCDYPAGWRLMPAERLAAVNEASAAVVQQTSQAVPIYAYGLYLYERDEQGAERLGAYSLIQVQDEAYRGLTFREIEASMGIVDTGAITDEISKAASVAISPGELVMNREQKRMEMAFSADIPGWGPSLGQSFQMLGQDDQVTLHFYTPRDQMEHRFGDFQGIAGTYAWHPGKQFMEAEPNPQADSQPAGRRRGTGPLGVLAISIAGIVLGGTVTVCWRLRSK